MLVSPRYPSSNFRLGSQEIDPFVLLLTLDTSRAECVQAYNPRGACMEPTNKLQPPVLDNADEALFPPLDYSDRYTYKRHCVSP